MKRLASLLVVSMLSCVCSAQQGQTSDVSHTEHPISNNSVWVQGLAPGYWATCTNGGAIANCGGLTLYLTKGTVNCQGTLRTYAGGTLTMTNSATNYVYLDPTSNCAPAVSTSTFTAAQVPIAVVVASGGLITAITDDRSWVNSLSSLQLSDGTLLATKAGVQTQSYVCANDSGATNAYAITQSPAPSVGTYSFACFKAANANTGASTLNVNGGGAVAIKKNGGTPLASGDITSGQIVAVVFDGTNWQILGVPSSSSGGYSTIDSNGSAVTQRAAVNFISGTGMTVSCVDNSGASRTDCTVTLTTPVSVANGGNGTSTPVLSAGANVTISGSWPNYTISATNSGGGGSVGGASSSQLPIDDTASPVGLAGFWTAKAITLADGNTYATPANNTALQYWMDVSGNNATLTSSSTGCSPVFKTGQTPGGGPAVDNTTAQCLLTLNGPEGKIRYRGEVTAFIVVKVTNLNNGFFISSNSCCGGGFDWFVNSSTHVTQLNSDAVGSLGTGTATWNTTNWHYANVSCVNGTGDHPIFRFDGASDATVNSAHNCADLGFFSAFGYVAGVSGFANCICEIAEVRLYHRALSTAEKQAVEAIEVASWF